jgi:hypothetical protein
MRRFRLVQRFKVSNGEHRCAIDLVTLHFDEQLAAAAWARGVGRFVIPVLLARGECRPHPSMDRPPGGAAIINSRSR